MKIRHLQLLLPITVLALSLSQNMRAQVTIGLDAPPSQGALLQLKEQEGPGANSTKGLMLPKVSLTNKTSLYPMFLSDTDYINNVNDKKNREDGVHTGLVVYNTNTDLCEDLYPATHLWNGAEWIEVGQSTFPGETDILEDRRDPNKIEVYRIGKFGAAGWWMLENMRAEKWPDGTSVGLYKDTPKANDDPALRYAYYYYPKLDKNDLLANPHHGYMYSWYAATRLTQDDMNNGVPSLGIQGICPNGWHIPSTEEWSALGAALESDPCQYAHNSVAIDNGYNIQSMEDTPNGKSRSIAQGGFNANLLGAIDYYNVGDKSAHVTDLGKRSYMWASDNVASNFYFNTALTLDHEVNRIARFPQTFVTLISVRCKKD